MFPLLCSSPPQPPPLLLRPRSRATLADFMFSAPASRSPALRARPVDRGLPGGEPGGVPLHLYQSSQQLQQLPRIPPTSGPALVTPDPRCRPWSSADRATKISLRRRLTPKRTALGWGAAVPAVISRSARLPSRLAPPSLLPGQRLPAPALLRRCGRWLITCAPTARGPN